MVDSEKVTVAGLVGTKEDIKNLFIAYLEKTFGRSVEKCSDYEKFEALVNGITRVADEIRRQTLEKRQGKEQRLIYYFSMEFLIGKITENYLINLGIKDIVEEALKELGVNAEDLYNIEPEPGLGNGGLGRLAACFMDSMAAVGVQGAGIGLRYRFGLFKQKIEDGVQKELPDAWLDHGYPWETQRIEDTVEVRFGGKVDRQYYDGEMHFEYKDYITVHAIPYDIPIVGANGEDVNTLRLYSAQLAKESIDMKAFNEGNYSEAMKEKCEVEAITSILYPDDSTGFGRKLRIRQEYLMVAAGLSNIIKNYKRSYGVNEWEKFPERIGIHINDTHPTMCIPELMRILIDEEGLDWDTAWEITSKTISFTNHTVLPEASERWPIQLMIDLLPRVYMMIEEIDRRFREQVEKRGDNVYQVLEKTAVLWNNEVRMANLSVIGSYKVNGVAALHSEILKKEFFNDFYKIYPERFNNKTNGISHRRFMIQANYGLAKLIDDTIGTEWRTDFEQIKKLLNEKENDEFLNKLEAVKRENKVRLANYANKQSGVIVNPDSMFDIQVKRFHAYKRQLLNVLKVMEMYNRIKDDPNREMTPITFVFSGKAAQGYAFAKETIRLIMAVSELINNDTQVNGKIQVVFIENFCVSNAQLIYPAADVSEQISTAGKEASGTGNMKFMMNGAVTLGTMDGANVEITNEAGIENEFIFGLREDEVANYHMYGGYNSQAVANSDYRLKRIMAQLVDGTLSSNGEVFWMIYDELLNRNDEFFVLADFDSYMKAFDELVETYNDRRKWNQMSLENIANSAFFSSDRTIREYADDIWKVEHR